MRYPASEKLEIIRLVEQSHQPVKRTLEQIGVSRPTFYRWYDLYRRFGEAALEDRRGGSGRVWNRIPEDVRDQVLEMALDDPELSPRELATRFTDERRYFVSEASVYRLLKACGLITSPTFIVSDLIAGGGLQTILDDFRRPAVGIYAVYPPGRLMPRRVQAFADFLATRFGDLPAWDRTLGISA